MIPLSHTHREFQYRDHLAQCQACKQVSSYDLTDEELQQPLTCRCGGDLRLFEFQKKGVSSVRPH